MDLKALREDKLKINTPQEFADLLGIDVAIITQWEQSPESISQKTAFEVIPKIVEKTGLPMNEIMDFKKATIQPLQVPNNWELVSNFGKTLSTYIKKTLSEISISDTLYASYINNLQIKLNNCLAKPKIAIVGRSDTGKSTLINTLLGAEKMPTSWTPTTSVAIYIKHISDRPDFMHDDVWIFASQVGDEAAWDEKKLYDEAYCTSWKIASGGIDELRLYCARQGNQYDKQAGSAVVFVDSPILASCDIVDLPGFGTETISDDEITFGVSQKADIIIYLSQANGFMRIEDITYLKRNIAELPVLEKADENQLPPLSNLFIVASQAHTINYGNREEIRKILDTGCDNLLKTFPYTYWNNRESMSGYSYPNKGRGLLRTRFFAYTTDIPDLCHPFNDALSQTLAILPALAEARAKNIIKEYTQDCKKRLSLAIQETEAIANDQKKYTQLLSAIEKEEPKRIEKMDKKKKWVFSFIEKCRTTCVSEFNGYFASHITVDAIEKALKDEDVENNESEIQRFISKLQNEVQQKCESTLHEQAQLLAPQINTYLSDFSQNTSELFKKQNFTIDFDAGWVYSSILSTMPKIGALSTLGGLGGFILTSSMVIAPIAFLLGLALTIPAGIVLGLGRLFSDSWQKKLATQIVQEFEKVNCREKYLEGIKAYWQQTSTAFDKATIEVEKQWQDRIADIRDKVMNYDSEKLEQSRKELHALSKFFINMPL